MAAGNIRIVKEIRRRRPRATIVINSILPRGSNQPGEDMSLSPLWQEVQKVNQWLKCYADSTKGVAFFNATSLFVVSFGKGVHQVEDYFFDEVHPSAKGSKGWAKAMVQRVHELIRRW